MYPHDPDAGCENGCLSGASGPLKGGGAEVVFPVVCIGPVAGNRAIDRVAVELGPLGGSWRREGALNQSFCGRLLRIPRDRKCKEGEKNSEGNAEAAMLIGGDGKALRATATPGTGWWVIRESLP